MNDKPLNSRLAAELDKLKPKTKQPASTKVLNGLLKLKHDSAMRQRVVGLAG